MKKGILINSHQRTFTEVEVDGLESMYKHIGCRLVEVVRVDDKNDLYVDEEGLYNIHEGSGFFTIEGFSQPLVGNGLVIGFNDETGESTSTNLTIEELSKKVKFISYMDFRLGRW